MNNGIKKLLSILVISFFLFTLTPNWIIPPPQIVTAFTENIYPSKDAMVRVYPDPDENFGGSVGFVVKTRCSTHVYMSRAFMEFDFSHIPPNTEITNAVLRLYVYNDDRDPCLELMRIKEAWGEYTITWNNQPDVYSNTDYANASWTPQLYSSLWENVTVLSLIDQSGGINDTQGFRLRVSYTVSCDDKLGCGYGNCRGDDCTPNLCSASCDGAHHQRSFWSREYDTDPSLRPYLEVTWQYTYPTNVDVSMTGTTGIGLTDYNTPFNSTGLVLLMHMDEDFGTFNVIDDSGYVNNGVLNGEGDEWVSRPLSKALMFDGVNDYINVTHDASLSLNTNFTIEAWFKTDMSATGNIIMKYNNTLAQSNYRIWITGGYLKLNVYDGTNDLFVTSPSNSYNDNNWHLVIGQWLRGDAAYLYVDNVLVNSTTDIIVDPVINNWTLTIGVDNDFSSNPFEGFLDEIRIYNRVINVTERTYSWVHGEAHYDNYVFANEDYYTFEGIYTPYWAGTNTSDITDLDTVQIGFSDGWHWMNASYNIADDEWSLLGDSSEYITLKRGTSSYSDGNITVTFPIYFRSFIIDALDLEIYMWCNNTAGVETDWELKAVDYFHIYNLGGQAEYTSFGNAGRTVGGDVLELYAYNSSWTQANITFRKLQSVHLYVRVEGNKAQWDAEEGDPKNITFGMYVVPDDDNVWIEGWKVVLDQVDKYTWIGSDWLGQRAFFLVWNASWYYKNNTASGWSHILSETFSSFTVWNGTDKFYTSLWVDFWFNKVNGSRLVGGRVNSEYFGIYNTASLVIFGWGTNFEAYLGNVTQSMFFHNLEDNSGEVISSKQVNMMKFYARVEQGVNAARDYAVTLKDYDILSFRIAPNQMEGIDTPIFVASKMPSMPSTGFLEALFGGFTIMGKSISEAITLGALWGWNIFVDFLDTVAAMLGAPNFFSNLFSQVAGFGGWMITSLGYFVTLITGFFSLAAASMTKFLTLVTSIFSGWVDIVQVFISIIDDGFNTGFNIYTDYIAIWMPLIPVGMLIYFYFRLTEDGIDAVYRDLQMIFSVFSLLFTVFITIIQVTLNIISTIIESIPVVE